jgi:hypothetical protein
MPKSSLDTVEFVMALEEEAFALSEPQLSLVKRIWLDGPDYFGWVPPDESGAWPERVLVLGREGNKVLFNAGPKDAFGVGCLSHERIVGNARVYPSLARALYAFTAHRCA